ncbi:hypothetical protein [Parasediminibacterium sp. JCM 36343]|uniref:hypothetical protein n=1 Tax=Parasediminibacterium sp. JCM 36343 TaxID=3374279 RepID=UPI00397A15EF
MNIIKKGFFILFLFLCGCIYDYGDGKLTLINNSKDTVYYKLIWDGDKILSNKRNLFDTINYIGSHDIIKPFDSVPSVVDNTSWEEFIESRFSDSTLKIIFMPKNLLNNRVKDSLTLFHSNYKIYRLTVKQLNKMNWRVSYP